MLEKTFCILKKIEEGGHTTDAGNAKLCQPIAELRGEKCDFDKNYLCVMYPPLTDEQIAEYSSYYEHHFPEELKQFFKYTNGIDLFDGRLSVGGLELIDALRPSHGGRSYKPMHRIDAWGNSPRKKKYWGDGKLFFAIYEMEELPHKFAYMDCSDPSPIKPVCTCFAGSEEVLETWESFDDWFASEYEKYLKRFENKEYKIYSFSDDGNLKRMYFSRD